MPCGFTMNRLLDELGNNIALIAGQIDEAEHLVKIDDDHTGDPIDIKFIRDDVRHVCSYEDAVRIAYMNKQLDSLSYRLWELRRRNDWVREDIEEPEAKVGDVVAETLEDARMEIKDGLRDRN